MFSNDFIQALKIVYEKLENTGIDWVLEGSARLVLSGMDFDPQDLDIALEFKNLKKAKEIFKEYYISGITELKPLGGKRAWEVILDIEGVQVQLFAEKPEDSFWISRMLSGKTTEIDLDGYKIPCLTLKAEAECYEGIGRKEKAEKIISYI